MVGISLFAVSGQPVEATCLALENSFGFVYWLLPVCHSLLVFYRSISEGARPAVSAKGSLQLEPLAKISVVILAKVSAVILAVNLVLAVLVLFGGRFRSIRARFDLLEPSLGFGLVQFLDLSLFSVLKLPALGNDDWFGRLVCNLGLGLNKINRVSYLLDLHHNVHALQDLPKDRVSAIKPRRLDGCNEELRAVGVASCKLSTTFAIPALAIDT